MASKSFSLVIKDKISSFNKTIRVDSDKSLSIRSFLIGSISQNISIVNNVLESEDVKSAIINCKKLGVKIKIVDGYVIANAPQGLKGAKIRFPKISVGATENLIIAASLAKGTTIL